MITSDQTLRCFLEQTLPQLEKCIADSDALSSLNVVKNAFLLPFRIPVVLFETPLNEIKQWVDLQVKIDPFSTYFKPSLSCLHNAFSLSPVAEHWKRCIKCMSSLRLRRGAFWIELDIGSSKCEPRPNLFIETQGFQGGDFVNITAQLFCDLYDSHPSQKLQDNLMRYARACMQQGDTIFGFGIMLARPGKAVRAHSSFNASSSCFALEERLREIGYSHDVQALSSLLQKFPPHTLKKLGLSLDIGEEISPTVGIERFETGSQSTREEWEPLLDVLVKEGLASAETAQKSLLWSGGSRKMVGDEHCSLFIRRIRHIKLTLKPTGELSAKIYLRIVHHLLPLKTGNT